MPEPASPVARHRVLPWALLAIAGGGLAVAAAAIFMVAQPGPLAAAKNGAIAACHTALANGDPGVTEASVLGERVFTSVDWQDYLLAIEAGGYGGHIPIDEVPADQVSEIDAFYTERRGIGEETVWVVWDIEGDDLWQCLVSLHDGEVLGRPVLSSPPME